eukprot:6475690-Amphidinium_carterae.1
MQGPGGSKGLAISMHVGSTCQALDYGDTAHDVAFGLGEPCQRHPGEPHAMSLVALCMLVVVVWRIYAMNMPKLMSKECEGAEPRLFGRMSAADPAIAKRTTSEG